MSSARPFEIGLFTFGEITADPVTGRPIQQPPWWVRSSADAYETLVRMTLVTALMMEWSVSGWKGSMAVAGVAVAAPDCAL